MKIKFVPLSLSIFSSFSAYADYDTQCDSTQPIDYPVAIFASEQHCQPNSLGQYNRCQNVERVICSDRTSPTDDQFLKSILYLNEFAYDFKCTAERSFDTEINIFQSSTAVQMSEESEVKKLVSAVPHSNGTFVIKVNADPEVTVWRDCSFKIYSNTTYPHVPAIREYIFQILQNSQQLNSIISSAEILTNSFADKEIFKRVKSQIKDLIIRKKIDENSLLTERDLLASIPMDKKSAFERQRYEALTIQGGLIDSVRGEMDRIKAIEKSLSDLELKHDTCLELPIEMSCTTPLLKLEQSLNGLSESYKKKIEDLTGFLDSEIERLGSSPSHVTAQLKSLKDLLNNTENN